MTGTKVKAFLPYFCRGTVIKGFGRGSKELGIPTANFPESVVEKLPDCALAGVYYGWGQVDSGPVHKMVMSIGWNPFYKNEKKSMETHIIHRFDSDFYGSDLGVVILGYIRPETTFNSLEELVDAIHNDIRIAEEELDKPSTKSFLTDNFFTQSHYSSIDGTSSTQSNL